MPIRGKPFKVISHSDIRVNLTDSNLKKLKQHQAQLQESRGLKVSANAIINECIHNYLKDEV